MSKFEVGERVKGKGMPEEYAWIWTVVEVLEGEVPQYRCIARGEEHIFWEDQIDRARLH